MIHEPMGMSWGEGNKMLEPYFRDETLLFFPFALNMYNIYLRVVLRHVDVLEAIVD